MQRSNHNSLLALAVLTSAAATSQGLYPSHAAAQDAFSCIDSLTDEEVQYRIRFIEKSFRDVNKKAKIWHYAWAGGYGAFAAAETYFAIDAKKRDLPEEVFGHWYLAAGSYLTMLQQLIFPVPDVWGHKRIREHDASTEEARRAKLRYGTNLLKTTAAWQQLNRGPLGLSLATVYGVVGGTVKAVKWPGKTPGTTAVIFISPIAFVAAQTFTAPKRQIEDWETYRGIACSSKYYQRDENMLDTEFSLNPSGARFKLTF